MVKRMTISLAVIAIALLAAVAAPALTLHTYRPDAVDFELAPAASGLHAAGAGYVSPPIRAPKRFDLLGMRWRGGGRPAVSVRVRRGGGSWSRWSRPDAGPADAPAPAGGTSEGTTAPVWAGASAYIQY